MKNLLYILFALNFFISCSSDDDGTETEQIQAYTSVTIANEKDEMTAKLCIIAYKDDNGKWIKAASISDINGRTESKEVKIDYVKDRKYYLFIELFDNDKNYVRTYVNLSPYSLKENTKNKLIIPAIYEVGTVNKNNTENYPN